MKAIDLLLPLVVLVLGTTSCEEKGLYQAPRFPKKENLSFESFSGDRMYGLHRECRKIFCSTCGRQQNVVYPDRNSIKKEFGDQV